MDFKKDILIPFLLNPFAGILFAVLIYLIQRVRYFCILVRRFDKVKFGVFYKYGSDKIGDVTLTVKGNRIHYEGNYFGNNNWEKGFEGEFIMNQLNLKFGEGFHYHTNYNGFNFPKIVIQDSNTIFIESSYYHFRDKKHEANYWADNHMQVPQAFVWKRLI